MVGIYQLKNKGSELVFGTFVIPAMGTITIFDLNDLAHCKIFEVSKLMEKSGDFNHNLDVDNLVFTIDDVEQTSAFFRDWMNDEIITYAQQSLLFNMLRIIDDKANDRILLKRFDGTVAAIPYTNL